MSFKKRCSFYRNSETLNMGRIIGYCDLDCDRTTCYGDTDLCEKADTLGKYLLSNRGKKEAWDEGRE